VTASAAAGQATRTAAVLLNPKAGTPRHPHLRPGRARAALALARALGGLSQSQAVLTSPCRQTLVMDADDDGLLVSLDGEVRRLAPPLRYSVRRSCLPVVAPWNVACGREVT
jgi:hypothetical protein